MKFRLIEDVNEKIIEKSKQYNSNQTKVGSALKNYSGSVIKRANPVGKSIGGKIYAHIKYINEIVPQEIIKQSNQLLDKFNLKDEAWSYNCFAYDPKSQILLFEESPDFDTAPEPVVGNLIKVDIPNHKAEKKGPLKQIWHHKWLWVKNDYSGFNVEDSWNRSKWYITKILESPNGSNIQGWKSQLVKYGLRDAE